MTGAEWLVVFALSGLEINRWAPRLPVIDRVMRPIFRVQLLVGLALVVWQHFT